MRFFRASQAVYVAVCQQLDAAYGYPNAETKTARTLPLAQDLPRDSAGLLYLAVSREYCDYILPAELLQDLLSRGTVEELTEAQYSVVVPPHPQVNGEINVVPAGPNRVQLL